MRQAGSVSAPLISTPESSRSEPFMLVEPLPRQLDSRKPNEWIRSRHAPGTRKPRSARSAQDAQALQVQRGYAVGDVGAGGHQPVAENRGQGDEHHGSEHV